jgi:hypothetical protein
MREVIYTVEVELDGDLLRVPIYGEEYVDKNNADIFLSTGEILGMITFGAMPVIGALFLILGLVWKRRKQGYRQLCMYLLTIRISVIALGILVGMIILVR